ncbi:hypothetical protein [Paraburkholderia phenazinium]|jgi:hypothetical protein|uniref:Uncharacterized protein n=1 Tax=Paraburkholderia phenazinium TaxID=60549 RepID=A0A1N6K508_9BURK|nr:hypothetical protein [Paraburkholderia phenazinium]SIO51621.1 hypothetical protein SAMN05444168_6044 [Paraburkholderia phenazinium]
MRFEPIEPTFGQASAADVTRIVTVRRVKKLTLMGAECNVGGKYLLYSIQRTGAEFMVESIIRAYTP